MNPLERFGKWFDSLWDNKHEEVPEAVTKSVISTRKMTPYERIVDAVNGKDRVLFVKLSIDKSELVGGSEYTAYYQYAFHKINSKIYYISPQYDYDAEDNQGYKEFTEKTYEKLFTDQIGKHPFTLSFDVKLRGTDIPKISMGPARACVKQARAHTAKRMHRQIYVTAIIDGCIHWMNQHRHGFSCRPWVLDVLTHMGKQEDLEYYKKLPAYQITSFEEVDRVLLPHDHWRRWVTVTELEDSKAPWVVRYVPRDIAQGKIRYFNVDVNFDAMDLGGISFDVSTMLSSAFRTIRIRCDEDLPNKEYRNPHHYPDGVNIRSDLDFNYDNLMVKHRDIHLSLKGYIKCQVKPVFHDNNPFLNPVHGMIDFNGHIFSFDHEFKIRDFHKRDITGDKWPDAK